MDIFIDSILCILYKYIAQYKSYNLDMPNYIFMAVTNKKIMHTNYLLLSKPK